MVGNLEENNLEKTLKKSVKTLKDQLKTEVNTFNDAGNLLLLYNNNLTVFNSSGYATIILKADNFEKIEIFEKNYNFFKSDIEATEDEIDSLIDSYHIKEDIYVVVVSPLITRMLETEIFIKIFQRSKADKKLILKDLEAFILPRPSQRDNIDAFDSIFFNFSIFKISNIKS